MRSYLLNTLIDATQEESEFDPNIIEETIDQFQNHISKLEAPSMAQILPAEPLLKLSVLALARQLVAQAWWL